MIYNVLKTRDSIVEAERLKAYTESNYHDEVVKKVERYGDGRPSILTETGLGFGWLADTDPPEPGTAIRVYGRFGSELLGVGVGPIEYGGATTDEIAWWRTVEDRELFVALYSTRSKLRNLEEFEAQRTERDAALLELPLILQLRMKKFLDTGGLDWRVEYEHYEMGAVVDAVKIQAAIMGAMPLKDLEGPFTEAQATAAWDKIKDLSAADIGGSDQHSGNSWGFAQLIGHCLVFDPRRAVLEHGAMVPLVGCEGYSCPHPLPPFVDALLDAMVPDPSKVVA